MIFSCCVLMVTNINYFILILINWDIKVECWIILGTRASMKEYMRCNLGLVKANAVVTRGGYAYNETQINAYINLFIYAQQYYGRKDLDDFR